ncbi:HNH endonuclease [Saccharothrix ecbatanensis]|nr:HNH endonuclease [Saccharothrix ecbatanensis]
MSDICHLCGLSGADTADHIIPRSMGGDHSIDNLAPAHSHCNYARGNKEL